MALALAGLVLVGALGGGTYWLVRTVKTAQPTEVERSTVPPGSNATPLAAAGSPQAETTVLLTAETARRLAADLSARGAAMVNLQDAALATADLGFPALDRRRLDELGRLYQEAYGRLTVSERTSIERYVQYARWGVSGSEAEIDAGRRLFAAAVDAMALASRQRLQVLLGQAVEAGILEQQQRQQRAGLVTQYTLPPQYVLGTPAPESPPEGHRSAASPGWADDDGPRQRPRPPSPRASERSSEDVQKDAAESHLRDVFRSIAAQARSFVVAARAYEQMNCAITVKSAACSETARSLYQYACSIGRDLEAAEEYARKSGVLPGVVRKIREENGLDDIRWDDLVVLANRHCQG